MVLLKDRLGTGGFFDFPPKGDDTPSVESIKNAEKLYRECELRLIDYTKKLLENSNIDSGILPICWELIKMCRAYIKVIDNAYEVGIAVIDNEFIFIGKDLLRFLYDGIYFLMSLNVPRYGFFPRLRRRIVMKREFKNKKRLLLELLGEYMPEDKENILYRTFNSVRARFSKNPVIDSAVYNTACDISDEIKAELIKDGADISELGLLPIGERAAFDENSPYTYPV